MGLSTTEQPWVMPGSSGLRREVGPLGLLCVSLGTIIGSAWLFAAAATSQLAGPSALVCWVLAGCVVAVLGLLLAELGAAYPLSGGLARLPHLALGPVAGFVTSWIVWLALTIGAPLEAEVALFYLGNKVDGLVRLAGGQPVLTGAGLVVAVALLLLFTAINALGVRRLSAANSALVWLKFVVPLLIAVSIMAASFHLSNFTSGEFAPGGVRGIVAALPAGVVFAFLGFEQAVQVAGEARNPGRDLPRAVLGAIGLATVMYVLLQIAFIGALDPARQLGTNAYGPFAALASGLGLGWLAVVVYCAAFASPAGCGLVVTASASRSGYAMSRNGYLPPMFERVDARGVPRAAMALSFVIGLLVLLPFPSWQHLVSLMSAGAALYFAFIPVAFAALRRSDPHRQRPYRLAGGHVLAPLGFVAASLIFYWAGWRADRTVLLTVLAGAVLLVAGGRVPGVVRARFGPDAWRSAAWLPPYYLGMAVLTYLGQFGGGREVIPFWWDAVLVAAFAVVIFRIAVAVALPADLVAAQVHEARLG
jgi:amino acid transporter